MTGDAFDRRSFIHRAVAVIPAMHAGPLLAMTTQDSFAPNAATSRFARLRLQTAKPLRDMAAFYRDVLRLPVEHSENSLTVTAGESAIEFTSVPHREGATSPYYHFAFNIPQNQLEAAKAWLEPRCPLVRLDEGEVIAHFESWNAHAIYFLDPAGNILEFIARHTLANDAAGEFSEKNILCASEIGIVAPDVVKAADQLWEAVKLERYRGGSEQFTAVGNEHGLFIIVKTGRRWFSSDRAAEVFPAGSEIRSSAISTPVDLVGGQFQVTSYV